MKILIIYHFGDSNLVGTSGVSINEVLEHIKLSIRSACEHMGFIEQPLLGGGIQLVNMNLVRTIEIEEVLDEQP